MWALVESNSISKVYVRPTSLLLNGLRYPANIFSLWSEAELKAIGIYEITVNNTNLKDKEYYQNTDITYTYNSDPDTVTGAYGTATVRPLADVLYTAEDESDGLGTEGDIKQYGLKDRHKGLINKQAAGRLVQYDWYTLRAASGGTAIPSSVSTYQAAVRTKANSMCTQIDGAANVDALAALYVYTDGTRPLGEWPSEPS